MDISSHSLYIPCDRLLACGTDRLLVAASLGDEELIERLVQSEGVSPSHEFKHGLTALHESCDAGHLPATNLLVDLGADVNKQVMYNMVPAVPYRN